MTDDWKKAFFEMAKVSFENAIEVDGILAVLREREDQEAVIDFLEKIANDDSFPEETHTKVVAYMIEKAKEGVKAKKELLEVYAETQAREIEERERVKEGRLGITVRSIVERVIERNAPEYNDALLKLIPKPLLGTELSNQNLHEIGLEIDNIRFKKEDELSVMLQMVKPDEKDMQRLREIINGTDKMAGELTSSQKEKIKEIKFLSNVAQIIIHQ